MSVQGGMNRSPAGLFRGDRSLWEVGLESEEIRRYGEAVDDAEAASLGRARMADGRRIELTVDELAQLVAPPRSPCCPSWRCATAHSP